MKLPILVKPVFSTVMSPSVDELKERYSSWPNNRLLSVLHQKEKYTTQAVEVARAELGQRNITVQEVDVFLEEEEKRQTAASELLVSLTLWEKALFFFVWFAARFTHDYAGNGLALKERQSHAFSMAGFVALILDGIASVYFDLGYISGAGLLLLFFCLFYLGEREMSYDAAQTDQ